MYKENLSEVSENLQKIFLDIVNDHTINLENLAEAAKISAEMSILFIRIGQICKTSDHYGVDPTLN